MWKDMIVTVRGVQKSLQTEKFEKPISLRHYKKGKLQKFHFFTYISYKMSLFMSPKI